MGEKKKGFHIVLYNEVAYFLALTILAASVNLTILSGWGAPLGTSLFYVLNLWISRLSIGQWSWVMQALWLITLILIVQQIHIRYFLSFFSAVLYGVALDVTKNFFTMLTIDTFWERFLCFGVGFILIGLGVQVFMKCNMPLVVYDLIAKEVTKVKHFKLGVVKTVLDVATLSMTAGIGLLIFGRLVGLGIGTVIIAFCTGAYLQSIDGFIDRTFEFRPLFFGRAPKAEAALQEPNLMETVPPNDITNEA